MTGHSHRVLLIALKRRICLLCRSLGGTPFVAGQPLGYYGSWPLFAFSHHLLVWWAAEQVRPGVRFDRYAVLGDDVLITDPLVAK